MESKLDFTREIILLKVEPVHAHTDSIDEICYRARARIFLSLLTVRAILMIRARARKTILHS